MADEKIRLVLNVSGVQDVKGLKDEMQALADALGVVDTKFEKLDNNRDTPKKLDEVKRGSTGAAQGLLQLGQMVDDVQYGFRGIVNNIPGFVQSMGLGAGVAGVVGIAAVAMNQLIQRFPELTDWMDKAKPKLADLTTNLGKQTAEVERLRKEYDKLKDSERDTLANRGKLVNVTEDLAEAEKKLAEEKAAAAALAKADTQQGAELDERMEGQKQSFKETFVDTGRMPKLKQDMMQSELERNPDITDEQIRERMFEVMAKENGGTAKEQKASYYGAGMNLSPEALYQMQKNADAEYKEAARQQLRTEQGEDAKTRVGRVLDSMQNAKSMEELDKAYAEMVQISPAAANELRIYHQTRLESEELDKEVDASIGGMQEARAAREKKLAEGSKQINNMKRFFGATEQAGKKDDAKAKAAQQEKDKAEKAEDQRVKLRDQVMERNGMTPEGLAMQRQNAGVGATAAANRNRTGMANNQQQQMEAEFRRQGMTAEEAKKTTQEVMKAGDNIVRTMIQNGQLTLNRFKQIEMTQNELARMMAQQAAGQVGMPGRQFNAGRR